MPEHGAVSLASKLACSLFLRHEENIQEPDSWNHIHIYKCGEAGRGRLQASDDVDRGTRCQCVPVVLWVHMVPLRFCP